ncbi:PREDICTED: uncharacterized protein LOC105143152 [Acromyrmex echinatior]|uniref:uncharacterized protein LOC105143152 n=1 Tax=Acromyrmex echinatior TaxID=103372 RepID=UPI00058104E9|nr:PREDICTED: uncharacterized protein LOC105143152 [Acromyrmex echinatior]
MSIKIFEKEAFPESWKSSLVVLIPKPDSKAQLGFGLFRTCEDNLTTLTTSVKTSFLNRSPTVAVFLDIAETFDNVNLHILINDLSGIGVPASFRKFVENLINVRHLSFVIDGELHDPYNFYKGTLQGSILSPLLFNIYLRMYSHRFLGIILDYNFSGKHHLKYLIDKDRKISDIISVLSRVK